jgi:peptidyl-prolyl cis-trans isomerase A (cyclophilin A)
VFKLLRKLHFEGLLICTAVIFAFATVTALAEDPIIIFETTQGEMTIELYPNQARKTVENILDLVDTGFYNGLIFHRVIANFMVQTGAYLPNMKHRDEPRTVANESNNGLKNDRYTLAMARLSDPNSAGAQFYINLIDNEHLNYRRGAPGYTVFGRLVDGTSVVEKIAQADTTTKLGMHDVPVEPIVIKRAYRR